MAAAEKTELLTVAQAAKILGVSRQALYKRMNNDLSTYVVTVDKRKWLDSAVLSAFFVNLSTDSVDKLTDVKTLQKMIEMLERENELKQQTIERLLEEKQEDHRQLMQLTEQVGSTLQALTQGQLADKLIAGQKVLADKDGFDFRSSWSEVEKPKQKKPWWRRRD